MKQPTPKASRHRRVYPKEGNRDVFEKYGVSQHKLALHAGASTATVRHIVHPGTVPVYGRDGVTQWKRRGTHQKPPIDSLQRSQN